MSVHLPPLPADYDDTRTRLHVVAAHVLARRRFEVTGRFGLRATPGGFGTPAFEADGEEVLRIAGTDLVREKRLADGAVRATRHSLAATSLQALARFAGTDLRPGHSVGRDTPDGGEPTAPRTVSGAAAAALASWLYVGALALDGISAELGPAATPSGVQLWPEHFDIACDLSAGSSRVNLGASLGDGFSAEPYVYIGPHGTERPGDPEFWNAPFGAFRGYASVARGDDPVDEIVAFLRTGCALLAG